MTNSKAKIILACASGQLGGTELRLLEEAKAMMGMGYQPLVGVSAFSQQARYEALLRADDIEYFAFNPPLFLERWRSRHWLQLRGAVMPCGRLHEADLVHVAFPWTNQGPSHLWMATRCRAPTVISVHNRFPIKEFTDWHKKHFYKAFASVRGIYGVSQGALDAFLDLFAEFLPASVQASVIYNFVDLDRFVISAERRRATRAMLGVAEDAPLLGSIGRFDKQKQPLSVVDSFAFVHKSRPDAHLLLIGEGDLEPEVRERVTALGLADAVTILPFQENIEHYFPALDVHFLLSRNEGFGLVTAEAMACGVPVVGTRVSGTTEVIGDCAAGRLVARGDQPAAAAAALELLSLPKPQAQQQARDYVSAKFGKQRWLEQLAGFYQAALSDS